MYPSNTSFLREHKDSWRNRTTGQTGFSTAEVRAARLVGANTRVISGTNPDWRVEISKGIDATNPYLVERWDVLKQPIPLIYEGAGKNGSHFYEVSGRDSSFMFPSSTTLKTYGHDLVLRDIAVARLKNRLRKEVAAYRAIAPTAELREARTLFRKLSTRCYEFLIALARAKRTKGKSVADWVSNQWLEFSFAIKPMIADISNLCGAIEAYLLRYDHSVRLTGSSGTNFTAIVQPVAGNGTLCLGSQYRVSYTTHFRLKYRFIAGHEFTLESSESYGMLRHYGLTWVDLPSALWELTPWSWMLDYFSTVGAFLDDNFYIPPGTTKYVVECRKLEATVTSTIVARPDSWCKPTTNLPGSMTAKFTVFERKPLAALPTRSLRLKSVDEIGTNAVNRLLNLAALLERSFGKKL